MSAPRPDLLTGEIVSQYLAGFTTVQIARAFGTSPATVRQRLIDAGVSMRPRGTHSVDQPVGYAHNHKRVRAARGRPSYCEHCGSTDPAKRYEWANLSGNYADPNDYKRLCKRCHMDFDNVGPRVGRQKMGRPRPDVAKLTSEIVQAARARHQAGESYCALGRAYGVHNATIRAALTGKTWKHA